MDSVEFSGIHVDSSPSYERDQRDEQTESLDHFASLPRRRNNVPIPNETRRSSDDLELDKLRRLVAEAEIERRHSSVIGCQRGSIEPSLMSTVFGLVLAIILTITFYAFFSLYQALVKRFYIR